MLMPTQREQIMLKTINAIKQVFDPEIPINIWELGLIYDIQITDEAEVVVLMTLTAPNCPEAEGIPAEVQDRIRMIDEVRDCKVMLTFEPPWDKDKLSEEAMLTLGLL